VVLSQEQRTLLESQTLRYQEHLYVAAEYLEGRGITEDTAVSARLGVVDGEIHGDPEAAFQRLSIPYITRSGVVDLRFRCIRDHECGEVGCAKYLGRPGATLRLYGVDDLVSAGDTIAVTEGELDRLILRQLGYPAVGLPGAESWKRHWSRLFEDFQRVVVFGDGDAAGVRFIRKFFDQFPQSTEAAQLPEGEDVNSMFLLEGPEYFERYLW
jgi:Toprim domain-containing protein